MMISHVLPGLTNMADMSAFRWCWMFELS